jgi:Tfp pilus assembly protein PilV
MTHPHPRHAGQRPRKTSLQGMALIEALVASAILGIGLAGATRLTLQTLQIASDTRQHTVAQSLGAHAMECHQSGRADCGMQEVMTLQGTRYTIQSQWQARAGVALSDIEVRVQWQSLGAVKKSATLSPYPETASPTGQLVLHSSRDEVPAWLGVSLP